MGGGGEMNGIHKKNISILKYNFVETPHKFFITKLSIHGKFMWCFHKIIL